MCIGARDISNWSGHCSRWVQMLSWAAGGRRHWAASVNREGGTEGSAMLLRRSRSARLSLFRSFPGSSFVVPTARARLTFKSVEKRSLSTLHDRCDRHQDFFVDCSWSLAPANAGRRSARRQLLGTLSASTDIAILEGEKRKRRRERYVFFQFSIAIAWPHLQSYLRPKT